MAMAMIMLVAVAVAMIIAVVMTMVCKLVSMDRVEAPVEGTLQGSYRARRVH